MSRSGEANTPGPAPALVRALFIGDVELGDFQPALAWLKKNTSLRCASPRAPLAAPIDPSDPPEWIILGQSREGEFSTGDITELRRRWPLARCVVIVGSWGEGEQAKQKVAAGAWRAAWHQWVPRAAEQLAARNAGRAGPWDRPLTLADEERHDRAAITLNGLRVAIVCNQESEAESLAECLAQLGAVRSRVNPPEGPVDATIWVDDFSAALDDTIASSCPPNVSPAAIVLTDFPRSSDWPQLLARPGGAVLGRPTSLSDLASLLREFASSSNRLLAASSNLH